MSTSCWSLVRYCLSFRIACLFGMSCSIKTDQRWFCFSLYSLPLPSKDTFFWDWEWYTQQPGLRDLSVWHGGREWKHPFHPVSSHGTWPPACGFIMALLPVLIIGLRNRRGIGHLEKHIFNRKSFKKLCGKRCSLQWYI